MALAELMTELAAAIGLEGVELEDDGGGQLIIDDDLVIDIATDPGEATIIVAASVGAIPADQREAAFGQLLEANLLGDGTGGAALAIDGTRDEIVLCRLFPQDDLPFAVFDRELSVFVQALRYWRQRCAAGTIGQAADDTVEQGADRGARLLKI